MTHYIVTCYRTGTSVNIWAYNMEAAQRKGGLALRSSVTTVRAA